MKKNVTKMFVLALALTFFVACQKDDDLAVNSQDSVEDTNLKHKKFKKSKKSHNKGFVHGIIVNIDGEDYYFAGKPDGPGGAVDVPGHDWVQAGPNRLVGKHYNTGPFGAPSWWSSDAGDGELLYIVQAIIDTWSIEKAEYYKKRGYVHHHEFVRVSDGELHPNKVPWLKHIAVTSFTFDRGPMGQDPTMPPPYIHDVTPGVDFEFPNNGFMPYPPMP